ncbi:MAG: hypothetical protein WDN25_10360 [Acetobacteraceae bacterium]
MAKSFNSPMRAGSVNCLKPVDAAINEAHWYPFNALGDGWFDADWRPVFNNARGVQAIEMMKEVTRSAQQGYTAAANDECTIAYQQDAGVMGLQWATRAKAMDDPTKSRIVGKIDWIAPPQGKARIAGDGYAISAFSKQDPDTLFRIIATSSNQANMRGAASLIIPPRKSLLDDPDLAKAQPLLPRRHSRPTRAAWRRRHCRKVYPVGEFITRRILQSMTGEMTVKQALDTAANENDHVPEGPRLLQVTSGAAAAARSPAPTDAGGCSSCRERARARARCCCSRWAMRCGSACSTTTWATAPTSSSASTTTPPC